MIQKLTRLLYKVNENMENISGNEESVKFDISFDIVASGIETNVLQYQQWYLCQSGTLTLSSILRFSGYFRLRLLVYTSLIASPVVSTPWTGTPVVF
jgi:hypothetical protein